MKIINNGNIETIEKLMTELNKLLSNSECLSVVDLDDTEYNSLLSRIEHLQKTIGFLMSEKFNAAIIKMQTFLDGKNQIPDAGFPNDEYYSIFKLNYKASRNNLWFSVCEICGFEGRPETEKRTIVFNFVTVFDIESILTAFDDKVKAVFV